MTELKRWVLAFRRAILYVGASAAVGWVAGAPLTGLSLGLVAVVLYWGLQLMRVQRWLDHPEEEPPETSGVWGQLFDTVYALQRRNREDRRRLESALDYLQDSLASMRDAAIIVDSRQNIAWANASAEPLLGIRFPQDGGQPLLNLIRFPAFSRYFELEEPTEPLRIEPSAEGELCLQFEISRFGDGDRLIFIRDVTDNYRLEQMRRDFVGNVSHELRTPLTVIKGYIQTLADVEAFSEQRFQKPLEQVGQQTQRMESLLKDLLWLSQIEGSETLRKTETLNPGAIVREIVDDLRTGFPERTIELEVDTETRIAGDSQELQSAFSNLIVNALKYSEDAPVSVCWCEREQHGVFSVRDRGIGISPQHLPRLTERFYRVDKSRSQRSGGTGLGLAIVKHVASAHQAELNIDSKPGQGSTFSMVFPLASNA